MVTPAVTTSNTGSSTNSSTGCEVLQQQQHISHHQSAMNSNRTELSSSSSSHLIHQRTTTTTTSVEEENMTDGVHYHHHHHHGNDTNTIYLSNIPSLLCAFSASATTGGTSYAFSVYSTTLKHNLHFTQGQLDSISTAFFVAGFFTFIPGYCSDLYGTKFTMSVGGCTGAISLILYWCVAKQFIIIHSSTVLVYILSALGITTFLSCGLISGAMFKVIVSSTGKGTKGSAVGVAKGFVGLGAGIYTCLFQSIQGEDQSTLDFLPMAAVLFLLCATLPAVLLLPSKQFLAAAIVQDDCTPLHFRTLYCSLSILAVIIITSTLVKLYETEARDGSESSRSYGMTLLLFSIWMGPIVAFYALPRGTTIRTAEYDVVAMSSSSSSAALESSESGETNVTDPQAVVATQPRQPYRDEPIIAETDTLVIDTSSSTSVTTSTQKHLKHKKHHPIPTFKDDVEETLTVPTNQEEEMIVDTVVDRIPSNIEVITNYNLWQMIQTPTAIAMLWTTVVLVGAGTVETNNMGQMVESLQFDTSITSASLAFFSVAQAASRVFTGTISESALTWNTNSFGIAKGIPRPFFMVIASIVGCMAHFLLGIARTEFIFVIGVTLSGIAFGMVWPIIVLIVAEVFGVKNAGQNYMFYDGVSSAGGTLLITKLIAQAVYDDNTDPSSTDSKTCIGMDCFQSTHMIVAGLCLSCVITSFIMMYTSRHTYNKPILHSH